MWRAGIRSTITFFLLCVAASWAFADAVLETALARGKLLVGTRDTKERFCFRDDKGGLVGIDVELGEAIGRALGLPVEFVVFHDFGGIKAAWEGNGFASYDIAVSTITITEEREAKADFSEPYFVSGVMAAVRSDAPWREPEELAPLRIGAIDGSSHQKILEERFPRAAFVPFRDYADLVRGLKEGRIDAVVADMIQLTIVAEKDPSIRLMEKLLSREEFGVAMPKGSVDLEAVVDQVVEEVKHNLTAKWFRK